MHRNDDTFQRKRRGKCDVSEQHHRDGQKRFEKDGHEIPSTLCRTVTQLNKIKQMHIDRESYVYRKRFT